jgi:hypothetical protein
VELGRTEEALTAFQHCLRLEKDDPATHYEIAYIYCLQREFETALEYLQSPLETYPEDWEVHNLAGKCYLGLRDYEHALASFAQGLMLTNHPHAHAELLDNIATVERHREFRTLRGDKDRMYASGGVVYLGSAQDNGLRINEAADYHFTYPDIGTTLQRLLALRRGSDWHFTALIAIDKLAQPLTRAMSHLLNLPLRALDELTPDDTALVVISVAREAELLELALERTPCNTVTFCLGVNWMRHSKALPDLIGIIAHGACSVPWESELRRLRADGARPEQVEACIESAAHQIIRAVHDTPPDNNLPRQVRYYTRNHRRLSFSPA